MNGLSIALNYGQPLFYVFCGFHHFSYNEDNSKNDKTTKKWRE